MKQTGINKKSKISGEKILFIIASVLFFIPVILFAQTPSSGCSTAAAQKITVGCVCNPITWNLSNVVGTPSPTACNGVTPAGRGGWGWFQATATSTTISYTNTNLNAILYVYSGTCGSLSLVSCANTVATTGTETITMASVVGQSYYVRVVSASSATTMNGTLCVYSPNYPSFDEPCSATTLTVGTTCSYNTYTNACASASAGIPAPGCGVYSGGDVWFSLTVPASGSVTIVTAAGVVTDGAMAVYSGNCSSLTLVACNDDYVGTMPELILTCQTPYSTLWVRFWENGNNNNGTFQICAFEPPLCGMPPQNDLPCNATALPLGVTLTGDNTCATSCNEPTGPSCWTNGSLNTVWYSVVCPPTGTIKVRTYLGSLTNTMIALYSGSCSSLSLVAGASSCNDDATPCSGAPTPLHSQITVTGLTPGSSYYVRVDGYNNLTGTFYILASDGSAFAPIPQQDCVNSTNICSQITTVGDPGFQGAGNVCDFSTPYDCFSGGGERNSVFYNFSIANNGTLVFDIIPNTSTTDYDFMLWNVTGNASACSSIAAGSLAPVRCNYSSTTGTTGIRTGYTLTSIGAAGVPFCSPLAVTAGQQFMLMINNYTGNNTGFSINYGTSPVSYTTTPTTMVWTGGVNTDWFNSQNWGGCGIPSCNINAVIVNGPLRQPVINAIGATCKSITIDPGASLTISGTNTLTVCGDYLNSGTLNASSNTTIIFNNGNVIQNINGNLIGLSEYPNLVITKTSGGSVILNQNIDIDGDFTTTDSTSIFNTNGNYIRLYGNFNNSNGNTTFSNVGTGALEFSGFWTQNFTNVFGSLTLNNVIMNGFQLSLSGANSNLIIGPSGKLFLNNGIISTSAVNEVSILNTSMSSITPGSMFSFVDGYLRRAIPASTGSYYFPVGSIYQGYEKATIDFIVAPSVPFTLRASFHNWSTIPNGPVSSDCLFANYSLFPAFDNGYWTINSSVSSGTGKYNIILNNLNYFNTTGSGLWSVMKRSPSGTGVWAMDGVCDPASTPGATKRDSLTGFSDFASVQFNSPFPIELVSFNAEREKNSVRCEWITASEINNDYFIIERSRDSKNIETVGKVAGAGNSTITNNYSFVDQSPLDGVSYYRLKQVDYDGKSSCSQWVAVTFIKNKNQILVYPNPAYSSLTCEFLSSNKGDVTISVHDITGKIIYSETKLTVKGQNKISLNISELADGFYFLSMSENNSDGQNIESKAIFTKVSN